MVTTVLMKTHYPISLRMLTFHTFTSGSLQRKGSKIFNKLSLFINYIKTNFPSQPGKR